MEMLHLAGCIIEDTEGRILLLHRNTAKRQQWEIPGGTLDEGEDAVATAIREVREEVGVDVEILSELGTKPFDEDIYTMVYTWFRAAIINGVPSVQEPRTHDKCEYIGISALEQMKSELSPNTRNFLAELREGSVVL